jgi:Flp pilus assembly pilin Flp
MDLIRTFWNDEQGATMAEYALLIALIAVTAIGSLQLMGGSITSVFEFSGDAMEEVAPESS